MHHSMTQKTHSGVPTSGPDNKATKLKSIPPLIAKHVQNRQQKSLTVGKHNVITIELQPKTNVQLSVQTPLGPKWHRQYLLVKSRKKFGAFHTVIAG